MRPPWFDALLADGPALSDGAWGTQMQAHGLPVGDCPDAWNLANPAAVESVARAYVEAGSQVILTNTFGASRVMLARHGLADQAAAINRSGVALSRRAADAHGSVRVFGSIGPSGRLLAAGEIDAAELEAAFREQARALAEGGADALLIETMSDLAEAALAMQAARETGLPVIASMTYGSGRSHDRTLMGTTPEQAAAALQAQGADAIGANCGLGIAQFVPLCARLRAATSLPIWIKPNAGLPELREGQAVYTTGPQAFAACADDLTRAGASFIGGCCGSTPEYIVALKQALAATRKDRVP